MQPDPLSEEVRAFLLDSIQSYEHLETLLLLYRSSVEWTASRVADELGIDHESALAALLHLKDRRLVAVDGSRFHFQPASAALAERTSALSKAYERSRLAVSTFSA